MTAASTTSGAHLSNSRTATPNPTNSDSSSGTSEGAIARCRILIYKLLLKRLKLFYLTLLLITIPNKLKHLNIIFNYIKYYIKINLALSGNILSLFKKSKNKPSISYLNKLLLKSFYIYCL
jgi:hypothetical protein